MTTCDLNMSTEHMNLGLQDGFPSILASPLAWEPNQLSPKDYVVALMPTQLRELENALKSFKELELDGSSVCCDTFPLPMLSKSLHEIAKKLHDGPGFVLLRGLDTQNYSPGDSLLLFMGIAAHVGSRRGRQDRKGNMITHIENFTNLATPYEQRLGIHSNTQMEFHNEILTDILALHVRKAPVQGGETLLASSWTIYQQLAKSRPDVIRTLSEGIWPKQIAQGSPGDVRPLLFFEKGHIIYNCDPGPYRTSINGDGLPSLTDKQEEALAVVKDLAFKHRLEISTQVGDLLFINNLAMLHARKDFPHGENQNRHLVRLWLHNKDLGWSIPKELQSSWKVVFGNRDDQMERYLVEPQPYTKVPRHVMIAAGDSSDCAHVLSLGYE